jgi:integrase
MPKTSRLLDGEMEAYLNELKDGGRSERTIHDYSWALGNMFQGLMDAKLEINPKKVGKKEIDYLRNEHIAGTNGYKAHMIKLLRLFLKWAGNKEIERIRIGFGDDGIRRIRWLSDTEAAVVRLNAAGIERMIVHCELDLGMRRIEVLRLKVQDFRTGRVNSIIVHGKGRYGGKFREIDWHPDTASELEAYLALRDREIEKTKSKNKRVEIPNNLLIYELGGRLYPYKKSAVDDFLKKLGKRVGIEFSNHDLRRTRGRMMYRAGVRIETIARIFGHSDTRTTIKYLGLDHEDMKPAMSAYAEYQRNILCPKSGTFALSQEIGGPNGI